MCIRDRRYSLLFRQNERELFPLCEEEGIAVIPYNPLAAGMLTGKHKRTAAPTEGRFTLGTAAKTYTDRYWHDREFDTVDAFVKMAKEAGVEPATLAVAWVIANPVITAANRRQQTGTTGREPRRRGVEA